MAHENTGGNPDLDKGMDLHNNKVGVGLARGGKSLESCFDSCEEKAKRYELFWWQPVKARGGPRRGLPDDYPCFSVDKDGRKQARPKYLYTPLVIVGIGVGSGCDTPVSSVGKRASGHSASGSSGSASGHSASDKSKS